MTVKPPAPRIELPAVGGGEAASLPVHRPGLVLPVLRPGLDPRPGIAGEAPQAILDWLAARD